MQNGPKFSLKHHSSMCKNLIFKFLFFLIYYQSWEFASLFASPRHLLSLQWRFVKTVAQGTVARSKMVARSVLSEWGEENKSEHKFGVNLSRHTWGKTAVQNHFSMCFFKLFFVTFGMFRHFSAFKCNFLPIFRRRFAAHDEKIVRGGSTLRAVNAVRRSKGCGAVARTKKCAWCMPCSAFICFL